VASGSDAQFQSHTAPISNRKWLVYVNGGLLLIILPARGVDCWHRMDRISQLVQFFQ